MTTNEEQRHEDERDAEAERDEDGREVPVHNEQRAALKEGGGRMDEQQSEVGEGVLDHAEHSDAPGPFGTS